MKAPQWSRDNLITLALIGGGGFLLYRAVRGLLDINKDTPYAGGGVVGTAANATNKILGGVPQAIGEAIGMKLADWFQKPAGETIVYAVTFPDGARRGVPGSSVNAQGVFSLSGKPYRIAVTASGAKAAVPL